MSTRLTFFGWLLVALDAGNWIYWISIASDNVKRGSVDASGVPDERLVRAQAAFLALASPHTVLIPTLGAILSDLSKHCSKDKCTHLETPSWQWYVFAFLVLPLDCITLAFNIKAFPNAPDIAVASVWSVVTALLVAGWVLLSLSAVNKSHQAATPARNVLQAMVNKRVAKRVKSGYQSYE
jgi:hypothetical protein